MKTRLERFFTETGKKNWIDSLQHFIANYNDSYHRTIGMAPSNVTLENQSAIFEKLYPKTEKIIPCLFKLNDRVRVVNRKGLFAKGYSQSNICFIVCV